MRISWALLLVLASVALMSACSDVNSTDFDRAYMMTAGGNARAGRDAIRRYGCNSCHTVSGVPGANGWVGPPLDGIGNRQYIAGELPNTADNLMRWIQHPHQVEAHTVMPEMNVTEQDSRDIAAYLYTLRGQAR